MPSPPSSKSYLSLEETGILDEVSTLTTRIDEAFHYLDMNELTSTEFQVIIDESIRCICREAANARMRAECPDLSMGKLKPAIFVYPHLTEADIKKIIQNQESAKPGGSEFRRLEKWELSKE